MVPLLGRNRLYLSLLLGGQMLQVALNVDQEGIQHVQDPEEDGSVGDGPPLEAPAATRCSRACGPL